MRRTRSGPQFESAPRDTPDTLCSLGRIFGTRQMGERARNDRRFVRKMRVETKIESSKKPQCASVANEHLKQHIRRSYVSRHRNKLPGLPVRDWSPLHSYLPGASVGYKRLWMQDNPWPGQSSKETGTKREGAQDYLHRMKYREQRRPFTDHCYVPGGTSHDPLNLAGSLNSDLPGYFQSPLQDPDRYNVPVNNFIPVNLQDPLGLTQDEDDQMPVALKYPLRKRKRSRCKKREQGSDSGNVPHTDGAETVNTSDDAESHQIRNTEDSGNQSTLSEESIAVLPARSDNEEDSQVVSDCVDRSLDSGSEKSAADVAGSSDAISDSGDNVFNKAAANSSEGLLVVSMEASSCAGDKDSRQAGDSGGDIDEPMEESASGQTPGNSDFDEPESGVEDHDEKKRGSALRFRSRSASLPQGKHSSDTGWKLKQEIDQRLKELQKDAFIKKKLYPVLQSPLDDEDRDQIPRNRKSLRKALKIEPIKPEEQEKVNKEREKKEREFKRLWRYPNLKSPDDLEDEKYPASKPVEALKVDVNLAPEKNPNESVPFQEPQLRALNSLVSPILRPDSSQIRKRRRTVSECSSDSGTGTSKKLVFRRSSSPDVRSSHHSPRKVRRLSGGSSGSVPVEPRPPVEKNQQIKYSKNPAYKHGNYYRYYGYRTPAMAPDFRLYFFRKEWFEGKDVLDVGCNAGDVTLAVAQLFHPKKIVGMDIDPNLIRIARQNIRSHQTKANMYQMEKFPVSTTEYGPIEPLPALTNPSNIFPKNVMFMQGNYVLKSDEELDYVKEEYDTILALSITKWIHLNHGDDGLKRVFHRIYQQLRPGGQLILEPQTWASYRRRKKLSATIYDNYNSIQLRPNDFANYLTETVGFCRREFLGQPFNPSKGFQRPLWLFTKYKCSEDNTPPPSEEPGVRAVGGGEHQHQQQQQQQQRSISERMACLAGYDSYHQGTPNLHSTPGPYSSSPAFKYHQSHPDNPYYPGPGAPTAAGGGPPTGVFQPYWGGGPFQRYFSEKFLMHMRGGINNIDEENDGDLHDIRHHLQYRLQGQERHRGHAKARRGRREESAASCSPDSSASSSGLNESCTSTNSSQPQEQEEQEQSWSWQDVSQEEEGEGVMEWAEEEEAVVEQSVVDDSAGQVELALEEQYVGEQDQAGFCNGHGGGDELVASLDQGSPPAAEVAVAVAGGEGYGEAFPGHQEELGGAEDLALAAGDFEAEADQPQLAAPTSASEAAFSLSEVSVPPPETPLQETTTTTTTGPVPAEAEASSTSSLSTSSSSSSRTVAWRNSPASRAVSRDSECAGQSVLQGGPGIMVQDCEISSSQESRRTPVLPPSSSISRELAPAAAAASSSSSSLSSHPSSFSQDAAGVWHITSPESSDLPPETCLGHLTSSSADDAALRSSSELASPSAKTSTEDDVLAESADPSLADPSTADPSSADPSSADPSTADVAEQSPPSDAALGGVGPSSEVDSSQCPDSEQQ